MTDPSDRDAFLGPMSEETRRVVGLLLELPGFELASHSIFPVTGSEEWAGGANVQVLPGEWWILVGSDKGEVIYSADGYNDRRCTDAEFVDEVRRREPR